MIYFIKIISPNCYISVISGPLYAITLLAIIRIDDDDPTLLNYPKKILFRLIEITVAKGKIYFCWD